MQDGPPAAPGAPAVLRGGHERAERVREHAVARVRGQQPGIVRQAAAVQGSGQERPQLRQPDALSGGRDRRQHGARRGHPELQAGGCR